MWAAASWLARAQDATTDGGVSGRYRLSGGWTSSYPETTGYIIPTFLGLAADDENAGFFHRAERCVSFLLPLQLKEGAFPGGEIAENRTRPSVFNTAQIINGLHAWHRATGDQAALAAACRAADWLVSIQDGDGAWRQHAYQNVATTYSSHAACWLAELGADLREASYLDAARRHAEWVIGHQDAETGWIDACGFTAQDHAERRAVTHTIAYTLVGLLHTTECVGMIEGVAHVRRAADGLLRRLELSGWLPGVLDHRWRARSTFACLTGNVQIALLWMRLSERTGDLRYLNAALKAIDLVKNAQDLHNANLNIRGAVAGSDPLWGDYVGLTWPNWAAKYLIDALRAKRSALQTIEQQVNESPTPGHPMRLPGLPAQVRPGAEPLRAVVYSCPVSSKVKTIVDACEANGIRVAAVLIERPGEQPALERLWDRVREDGLDGLRAAVTGRLPAAAPSSSPSPIADADDDVRSLCASRQIRVIDVGSLARSDSVAVVRELAPDLAIYAGGGILRPDILAVPRLGTLNAHMALLPQFRGMNVAEWSVLSGATVGCSVHLLDRGIDTGDVLATDLVDIEGVQSIAALRERVDRAQRTLLESVIAYVGRAGALPPRAAQRAEDGVQYYRMHSALQRVTERRLARAPSMAASHSMA